MKHFLGSLFLIIGLTVSVSPGANASTEGCPNSWVIDTSSYSGIQELELAKQKLGANMALSEPRREYSDWSGELGPLPAPKIKWLTRENDYLYGKTKVTSIYSVQIKDCPQKIDFRFVSIWEQRPFTEMNPTTFAEKYPDNFVDFTFANSFEKCVQRKVQALVTDFESNSRLSDNKWKVRWPSELQYPMYSANGGNISNCGLRPSLIPISLSPNCKWIEDVAGNPAKPFFISFGPSVTNGSKCKFGFTTYIPNSYEEIPYFALFVLDSANLKSTITCIKGKVTKKVTAVNPKCPAGYKKK